MFRPIHVFKCKSLYSISSIFSSRLCYCFVVYYYFCLFSFYYLWRRLIYNCIAKHNQIWEKISKPYVTWIELVYKKPNMNCYQDVNYSNNLELLWHQLFKIFPNFQVCLLALKQYASLKLYNYFGCAVNRGGA